MTWRAISARPYNSEHGAAEGRATGPVHQRVVHQQLVQHDGCAPQRVSRASAHARFQAASVLQVVGEAAQRLGDLGAGYTDRSSVPAYH